MRKFRKSVITVKFCSYLFVYHSEGKYIQAFRIFFLESERILFDVRNWLHKYDNWTWEKGVS